MLPVLQRCAQKAWVMKDLVAQIADDCELTQDERDVCIPSGSTVISSRVHWAKTYLKQAGLIGQPKRGVAVATERGKGVLAQRPEVIDLALLQNFDDFKAFWSKTNSSTSSTTPLPVTQPQALPIGRVEEASSTPEEQIDSAYAALSAELRDALLARVLEASPTFFEHLIIDLLLAMGYGGSRKEAGKHLGRTGDGGVDGVIQEDQLGLDRIYLQAKRYKSANKVSGDTVQAFIGALVGKGAQKGVLITTSAFTPAAVDVAKRAGNLRVVLIDGDLMTTLMVRFGVGVRLARAVEIKKIDLDYFEGVEAE